MIRHQYRPAPAIHHPAATGCRMSLVERLASDMREMAFAGENVCIEALKARGWRPEIVTALQEEATRLATRQSIRRVRRAGARM